MATHLFFSNHLERLGEKLSQALEQDIGSSVFDIFRSPVVIVPNQNLAQWLKLVLAEKRSIFMNVDFRFLEEGLWRMVHDLDPGQDKAQRLDMESMKIIILHILHNSDHYKTCLTPLTNYLEGMDGKRGKDYSRRVFQLSEKLSFLLMEYEFHRLSMIQKWKSGGTVFGNQMEACQKDLYLLASELKGKLGVKEGIKYLSLTDYAESVLSSIQKPPETSLNPGAVHIFGISQISSFHLDILSRLQHYYEIFVYALNPSGEFWEDIMTMGEIRWIKRKSSIIMEEDSTEQENIHPLLSAWGKPGRESIKLLCSLTDYEFNSCFESNQPGTILHEIQERMLTLSHGSDRRSGMDQDLSLQIMGAPSRFREVETVFNSILLNLEQDPKLRLTEIAVMVPDMKEYRPALDSFFQRNREVLPYSLVDSNAEAESVFAAALMAIIDLAEGRFTRKDIFLIMLNPCFAEKWKISREEVEVMSGWAENLGIFHGFDKSGKEGGGSGAGSSFTWRQGLSRLRLSRIMEPMEIHGPEEINHFHGMVPYKDMESGDHDLVEKFSLVIDALNTVRKNLAIDLADAAAWKKAVLKACDDLLAIPPGMEAESLVFRSLIQALDRLDLYDSLCSGDDKAGLDSSFIREYLRSTLNGISGGHGNYLFGGITISQLQPMRPIPFKIIYILGMEEGNFPGKADNSVLDLRLIKRRIGDISLPEKNAYLFLEMLISVRRKLYISYLSRDLQKDRILQPCSVINQLKRYVETQVLPPGVSFKTAELPLKAASPEYLNPGGFDKTTDVMVDYDIAQRIAFYRSSGLWENFLAKGSAVDIRRASRFSPDFSTSSGVEKPETEKIQRITLSGLKYYLENPLKQCMRNIGISKAESPVENRIKREDEPFYAEFPVNLKIQNAAIEIWMENQLSNDNTDICQDEVEIIHKSVYDDFQRKSLVPEGFFGATDEKQSSLIAARKAALLLPLVNEMKSAESFYRIVFVGDPMGGGLSLQSLPLLRFPQLELPDGVMLMGELPWVWKDKNKNLHVLVITNAAGTTRNSPDKYLLGPVLFFLFLVSGKESEKWLPGALECSIHVVFHQKVKNWSFKAAHGSATAYLGSLTKMFMDTYNQPWLPFGPCMDILANRLKPKSPDSFTREERQRFREMLEEELQKEKDPMVLLAKPKIPLNCLDLAVERFGIFIRNLCLL